MRTRILVYKYILWEALLQMSEFSTLAVAVTDDDYTIIVVTLTTEGSEVVGQCGNLFLLQQSPLGGLCQNHWARAGTAG